MLPPGRAPGPPDQLGQDLPHGVRARSRRLARRRAGHHPGQRDEGVLHPSDRVSRVPHAGRQPASGAGRCGHPALGMGRLSRQGRARAGRRHESEQLVADGAQHAARPGEMHRQLRQLSAHQDGGARRRLLRRHRARRLRQRQRRQRREHLPGARRRHLHAVGLGLDPARHHPRLDHHAGDRSRVQSARGDAAARAALYRRRGVLRRHGRRGHADQVGRQDLGRQRPPRTDHAGAADRVLRRHQRRGARHARVAHLRLSGGKRRRAGSRAGRHASARAGLRLRTGRRRPEAQR